MHRQLVLIAVGTLLSALAGAVFTVRAQSPATRISTQAEPAPTAPSPATQPSEPTATTEPEGDKSAPSVDKLPPALTHYKGREIAQTMHYTGAPWLVRDSRQREEDCETLLKALGIKSG